MSIVEEWNAIQSEIRAIQVERGDARRVGNWTRADELTLDIAAKEAEQVALFAVDRSAYSDA